MITKRFEIYVPLKNLNLFMGKLHYSLEKVPFSPRKIHLSLGKLYFSSNFFYYFRRNLLGISI
jgi:hypothetical protein